MSYHDPEKICHFFADNPKSIDSKTLLHLLTLLNLSEIDPDNLLIKSCMHILNNINIVDETHILPFSLSLRYGANPNILINSDTHIVKYIDCSHEDKYANTPMINSMHIVLMLSGTNYQGEIKSKVFSRYNKNIDSMCDTLDKKYINKLLTMLDNTKYINNYDEISISEVVRDHSSTINGSLIYKTTCGDDTYFNLCIKYFNYNALDIYISYGHFPSYYIINNILVSYNYYKSANKTTENNIVANQLKEMIKCILDNGYKLDPYQSKYLNEDIETMYGNKKISDSSLNDELKMLADILFIDSKKGKKHIINELRIITDIKRLKEAAIKMSMLRTGNMIFGDKRYRKIEFENIHHCLGRRFDNITRRKDEMDIIYYTDNSQITWLFTSEIFEKLISTKTNIYTDEPIDQSLIQEISRRRNSIKRLGFMTNYASPDRHSPGPAKSISHDIIDYITPQRFRNKFFYMAKLYEITPSQIEGLQIDNIQHIISSIHEKIYKTKNIINVKILHKDHAHQTFYRYICDTMRDNINIIPSFFSSIKQMIRK